MTSYIAQELRRLVIQRAGNICEYCQTLDENTMFGLQVDHVIAEKHGGATDLDNLALACVYCNRYKGTDIGSIASSTGEFTRFFNPRIDEWDVHFEVSQFQILPLTPIGETTVSILQLNAEERLMEREAWISCGVKWPAR